VGYDHTKAFTGWGTDLESLLKTGNLLALFRKGLAPLTQMMLIGGTSALP
jgi:hypothetical protein